VSAGCWRSCVLLSTATNMFRRGNEIPSISLIRSYVDSKCRHERHTLSSHCNSEAHGIVVRRLGALGRKSGFSKRLAGQRSSFMQWEILPIVPLGERDKGDAGNGECVQ
jgi:hypothetical protein